MKTDDLSDHSKPFRKACDLMNQALNEIMKCSEDERKEFSSAVWELSFVIRTGKKKEENQ